MQTTGQRSRNLLVLYDGSGFGGLETHVELFVGHLDRRRYRPHVVIPGRLRPVLSETFLDVLRANEVPFSYTEEGDPSVAPFTAFPRTIRALRALGADVAFVETCTAIGLRKDLLAFRLAGLPIVRFLHMPASAMVDFYGRPWKPWKVRALNALVARNLVLTQSDRQGLIETFGLDSNRIEICRQGQDFERFTSTKRPGEARAAVGLDPAIRTIGLIGRLTRQKGQKSFIDAAARLNETMRLQFVLVGRGEDEVMLRAHAAARGLDASFVFAGFQRDVRPWIEACDLIAMPSLWESAPMVLLECLAMQKPIVVSDLSCFREHVGDDACVFVPPENAEALADGLRRLLHDDDAAMKLARTGSAVVRSQFHIGRHVGQIMNAFDAAIQVGSRPRLQALF